MRTSNITFAQVVKEIEALIANGEKLTVRNVIARTGGSANTVSDFIKRWQGQQRVMRGYALSDTIVSAFISEIDKAVDEALKDKVQELEQVNLLNDELRSINNDLEINLSEYEGVKAELVASKERGALLEQELQAARTSYDGVVGKSAVLAKSLEDLSIRFTGVENDLLRVGGERRDALGMLATYKVKAEQLQEQLDKLYSQLKIS